MRLTRRPANSSVGTGFGPRPKPTPASPEIHYGQDYGWGSGRQVYAAKSGVVKSVAPAGAYGLRIIIDHGDGWETWYCHLSAAYVAAGQEIEAGAIIGWMGATGNALGVHLHFELRRSGVAVDPEPYFASSSPAGDTEDPIEEEDMFRDNVKIVAVKGTNPDGTNGTRGVIGAVSHLFTGPTALADYTHFCTVWGIPFGSFDIKVEQHAHLESLIRTHQSNQNIADDEAKILAGLKALVVPPVSGGDGLTDADKAEIVADVVAGVRAVIPPDVVAAIKAAL